MRKERKSDAGPSSARAAHPLEVSVIEMHKRSSTGPQIPDGPNSFGHAKCQRGDPCPNRNQTGHGNSPGPLRLATVSCCCEHRSAEWPALLDWSGSAGITQCWGRPSRTRWGPRRYAEFLRNDPRGKTAFLRDCPAPICLSHPDHHDIVSTWIFDTHLGGLDLHRHDSSGEVVGVFRRWWFVGVLIDTRFSTSQHKWRIVGPES